MAGLDRLLLSFMAASNGLRFFGTPDVSPETAPVWRKNKQEKKLQQTLQQKGTQANNQISWWRPLQVSRIRVLNSCANI